MRKQKWLTDFVFTVKKKLKHNDEEQVKKVGDKVDNSMEPTILDLDMMDIPNTLKRDRFIIPTSKSFKVYHYLEKVDQEMLYTIYMLDKW